jgi:hypothetical protein
MKPTLDYFGSEPSPPRKARAVPKPKPVVAAYLEVTCILILAAVGVVVIGAVYSAFFGWP